MTGLIGPEECEQLALTVALLRAHLEHGAPVARGPWWVCGGQGCGVLLMRRWPEPWREDRPYVPEPIPAH